jgi:hypothetical protein
MAERLEAQVRVARGIPHSKYSLSLLMVQYSNDTYDKKNPQKHDKISDKYLVNASSRPWWCTTSDDPVITTRNAGTAASSLHALNFLSPEKERRDSFYWQLSDRGALAADAALVIGKTDTDTIDARSSSSRRSCCNRRCKIPQRESESGWIDNIPWRWWPRHVFTIAVTLTVVICCVLHHRSAVL